MIIGDNGASAEGTLQGAFNEMANFNGMGALETPEFMVSKLDDFGSPSSYNHFAVGWAWAMDTPYQWTKQVASHWGGTRNGTIVRFPKLIKDKGGVRHQFSHVIDVAPTVLEVAGIPEPTFVHGVQQSPYEGTSMVYSFGDAAAPERHDLQYFEMFGNRGIYYQGWSAVTQAQDAVGLGRWNGHRLRRRRLGAVRREHGLDPGPRPVEGDARQAPRAATPIPDRGDPLPRPAARRPSVSSALNPRLPGGRRSSRATRSSCSRGWAGCPRTVS